MLASGFTLFRPGYIRSATFYLGLKLIFFTVAGVVTQYLLTNHLTKNDYGLYSWINTIIALLGPVGLPGISVSITTAIAKGFDRNFKKGTYLELIGGVVGGIILLGFADYYWFFKGAKTEALLFAVAGVLGPGLWLDTYQCYWNGKGNFARLFWWSVPIRLLQLAAIAVVFQFVYDPVLVFASQAAIQVLGSLLGVAAIFKYGRLNDNYSKELHKYGWVSNHMYLLGTLSSNVDKLVVGAIFSFNELAVYTVAELVYNYFYKVPRTILEQIALPKLAKMSVSSAARWITERQRYLILFVALLLVITYFLLPQGYVWVFSNKYSESVVYARLYLINIFVSTPLLLVGAFIKSHGLTEETKRIQAILSFAPLLLLGPCVYFWNLKGIVFARIMQNILASAYCFRMLRKACT